MFRDLSWMRPAGQVPDWAQQAAFYHIYPYGFLGAPATNDGRSDPVPRLADLRQWYDHLSALGVSVLWLGPVFESRSHGYDTLDYFRIDRRLGDLALFQQVLDELHQRGFRVLLDGAFHHTSRDFFAFRDLLKNGPRSPYAEWYHVDWQGESPYGDGFAYEAWEGHADLPRLNLANSETRGYILEVARMWLADVGADGWRVDVAYELEPDFLWELRRACKAARSDCFLLGEVIHGDYRTWVAPDLLDAGTNYQFNTALWRSFNEGNLWELKAVMERAWHTEWGLYRDIVLLNFLGNHDVTRILSRLDDPRHIYPALIVLFTAPGIPCLYYGDEVGLTGRKEDGDAALRAPMPLPSDEWPDAARDLYRETARLAHIRRRHPALVGGRFAALYAGSTGLAFLRQHSRQVAIVTLNAADAFGMLSLPVGREGIPDGTRLRDALEPHDPPFVVEHGTLTVETPPCWGRILVSG